MSRVSVILDINRQYFSRVFVGCSMIECAFSANAIRSPFLQFVSSTTTFDEQLSAYVATSYVQEKYFLHSSTGLHASANALCRYQNLLGCGNINLTNTTNLYARFTTTVICNSIIQNSRTTCGLSSADSRPVCADTCVCPRPNPIDNQC